MSSWEIMMTQSSAMYDGVWTKACYICRSTCCRASWNGVGNSNIWCGGPTASVHLWCYMALFIYSTIDYPPFWCDLFVSTLFWWISSMLNLIDLNHQYCTQCICLDVCTNPKRLGVSFVEIIYTSVLLASTVAWKRGTVLDGCVFLFPFQNQFVQWTSPPLISKRSLTCSECL